MSTNINNIIRNMSNISVESSIDLSGAINEVMIESARGEKLGSMNDAAVGFSSRTYALLAKHMKVESAFNDLRSPSLRNTLKNDSELKLQYLNRRVQEGIDELTAQICDPTIGGVSGLSEIERMVSPLKTTLAKTSAKLQGLDVNSPEYSVTERNYNHQKVQLESFVTGILCSGAKNLLAQKRYKSSEFIKTESAGAVSTVGQLVTIPKFENVAQFYCTAGVIYNRVQDIKTLHNARIQEVYTIRDIWYVQRNASKAAVQKIRREDLFSKMIPDPQYASVYNNKNTTITFVEADFNKVIKLKNDTVGNPATIAIPGGVGLMSSLTLKKFTAEFTPAGGTATTIDINEDTFNKMPNWTDLDPDYRNSRIVTNTVNCMDVEGPGVPLILDINGSPKKVVMVIRFLNKIDPILQITLTPLGFATGDVITFKSLEVLFNLDDVNFETLNSWMPEVTTRMHTLPPLTIRREELVNNQHAYAQFDEEASPYDIMLASSIDKTTAGTETVFAEGYTAALERCRIAEEAAQTQSEADKNFYAQTHIIKNASNSVHPNETLAYEINNKLGTLEAGLRLRSKIKSENRLDINLFTHGSSKSLLSASTSYVLQDLNLDPTGGTPTTIDNKPTSSVYVISASQRGIAGTSAFTVVETQKNDTFLLPVTKKDGVTLSNAEIEYNFYGAVSFPDDPNYRTNYMAITPTVMVTEPYRSLQYPQVPTIQHEYGVAYQRTYDANVEIMVTGEDAAPAGVKRMK